MLLGIRELIFDVVFQPSVKTVSPTRLNKRLFTTPAHVPEVHQRNALCANKYIWIYDPFLNIFLEYLRNIDRAIIS